MRLPHGWYLFPDLMSYVHGIRVVKRRLVPFLYLQQTVRLGRYPEILKYLIEGSPFLVGIKERNKRDRWERDNFYDSTYVIGLRFEGRRKVMEPDEIKKQEPNLLTKFQEERR